MPIESSDSAKDIFLAAVEMEAAEDRNAYLSKACGSDEKLRLRVEALLHAHERPESLLDQAAAQRQSDPTDDFPTLDEINSRPIGPYQLREQIGEGGMGAVFVAEQEKPLKRKVALKLIKPGMDTKSVIARFEAERQALAVLDHPNIAKVLDAGTTDEGRPFFVMELVRGVDIMKYCDENHLPIRERLELFLSVCQAIQHAHQKGIIHRDIKPSNVLVTEQDGKAIPKVIDFGVAKAIGQSLTDRTIYTSFQSVIGTPLYMSPEQAALSNVDVDTRSDVYSLGVLFYELLTGFTPFDKETLKNAAQEEVLRIIREDEPPKPSTKISTLGEQASSISKVRSTDAIGLGKLVRGDLDWIAMKALEKDRNRRYESPANFSDDVTRYLTGEPIIAHPPSTFYRLRKFVNRHRAFAGSLIAIVVSLSLGLVGTSIGMLQSFASEKRLEEQNSELITSEKRLAEQIYGFRANLAFQAFNEGNRVQMEELLEQLQSTDGIEPGFELKYLLARQKEFYDPHHVREIEIPRSAIHLSYSPDGRFLAIGLTDQETILYDVEHDEFLDLPLGLGSHPTISSSGKYLAVCSTPTKDQAISERDLHGIRIVDLATREEIDVPAWQSIKVQSFFFSPDETKIACIRPNGVLEIRELKTGNLLSPGTEPDSASRVMQWTSDGQTIITSPFCQWDAETLTPKSQRSESLKAISGDGKIVSSQDSFSLNFGDVGVPLSMAVDTDLGEVTCAAFHPNEKWVALGGADYKVRILDTENERQIHRFLQREYVGCLTFSPDGKWLAVGGREDVLRLWDTSYIGVDESIRGPETWLVPLAVTGMETETIATCEDIDGKVAVKLWFPEEDKEQTICYVDTTVTAMAFSPSGTNLAFGGEDGSLRIWDSKTEKLSIRRKQSSPFRSMAFSPDGRFLVTGHQDGAFVYDVVQNRWRRLSEHLADVEICCVAFSSKGQLATSGGFWHDYGETILWEMGPEGPINPKKIEHPRIVRCVAFSPDGTEFAITHDFSKGEIRFFDSATRQERGKAIGHYAKTISLAYTNDGKRLLSGSDDETIRFWNVPTGEMMGTLHSNEHVRKIRVLRDGISFVTGSLEHKIRVYRAISLRIDTKTNPQIE